MQNAGPEAQETEESGEDFSREIDDYCGVLLAFEKHKNKRSFAPASLCAAYIQHVLWRVV